MKRNAIAVYTPKSVEDIIKDNARNLVCLMKTREQNTPLFEEIYAMCSTWCKVNRKNQYSRDLTIHNYSTSIVISCSLAPSDSIASMMDLIDGLETVNSAKFGGSSDSESSRTFTMWGTITITLAIHIKYSNTCTPVKIPVKNPSSLTHKTMIVCK